MKTIALLILLCLPVVSLAQEKLTTEQIAAAVPGAPAEFILAQQRAGAASADQVRIAWLVQQKTGSGDGTYTVGTLVTIALTLIVRVLQAEYHKRMDPKPAPATVPSGEQRVMLTPEMMQKFGMQPQPKRRLELPNPAPQPATEQP